ncbi:hypothetical protein P12x_002204 [Tundrisphaera lichenicola]|uniref:hypothetical protein n=1 Tax=Tundrisphaera lichenicola TaxID=2029860 RepID=UPI003EC0699B
MDSMIRAHLAQIHSDNREEQGQSFRSLMEATEGKVGWAYEAWDELRGSLSDRDNHRRAIAAQLLCNLAKSDPEGRMMSDFDALLDLTRDERFVTARHCLLSLWKVGLAGEAQRKRVIAGLAGRFEDCIAEKNSTLIRSDIIQGLRKLHEEVGDEAIRSKALELIETEEDPKYRKKYASVWKKK